MSEENKTVENEAAAKETAIKAAAEKEKPARKAGKGKPAQVGMTPERAKEMGLDPFPYGG